MGNALVKLSAVFRLSRPFTLLAPAVGMLATGLAAVGFSGPFELERWSVAMIALGTVAAAVLNIASNSVNQIYDVEVDRINKPERPLPAGDLSLRQAGVITVACYAIAIAIAAFVNLTIFWIVLFTALLTYAYSGPPLRTKRHWAFANITIAIPRGFLLPLAGWAAVSGNGAYTGGEVLPLDIWLFAAASGLFVLGAATTKDYADLEGDRAGGCITLPLRFGVERSVRFVAPFLVLPWLAWAVSIAVTEVSGNRTILFWGSLLLAAIGGRAAWLLLRDPDSLTSGSTHPSWVLMYLMMIGSQVVFALGYVISPDALPGLAP